MEATKLQELLPSCLSQTVISQFSEYRMLAIDLGVSIVGIEVPSVNILYVDCCVAPNWKSRCSI